MVQRLVAGKCGLLGRRVAMDLLFPSPFHRPGLTPTHTPFPTVRLHELVLAGSRCNRRACSIELYSGS